MPKGYCKYWDIVHQEAPNDLGGQHDTLHHNQVLQRNTKWLEFNFNQQDSVGAIYMRVWISSCWGTNGGEIGPNGKI